MLLYEKAGHSKLVEMHWDVSNFYRFASQSNWYFILATGLKLRSIYRTVTCRCERSCGTVSLYGPFYLFFFVDHRATVFTLSKTFETAQTKSCATFLPIFVMKSGVRTIKHIYFVSLDIYLHSSILTCLLIFISSSLS